MIRTVFLDFGNVVAFFDHGRTIQALLPHTDRSGKELMALMYTDDLAVRYESGLVTTDEVFEVGRSAGGLRCTRAEFEEAFCNIFWPNPPMAGLVPRLKTNGHRLVLASNTNAAHYARYRDQFRAELSHFDAVVVSHEAGARKPDPRFFEYAHRFAECDKAECVFVDDIAENVEAARRFGWHAVQYTGFEEMLAGLAALGVKAGEPAA
jgi:HAD superfamily hydrolase (TIGR01509 family)